MGEHNHWKQAGSLNARDAQLDGTGKVEAEMVGAVMKEAGLFEKLQLAIVSPFRRTLETTQFLFNGAGQQVPTEIQPLCAEDTMPRAEWMQGNLGSTAEELRDHYPMFDFTPVDEYCAVRGTGDEWWRHWDAHTYETPETFAERANDFKQWLATIPASHGVQYALVVSHGGFLKEAFGYEHAPNCGFRVYDIMPDGTSVHLRTRPRPVQEALGRGSISNEEYEYVTTMQIMADKLSTGEINEEEYHHIANLLRERVKASKEVEDP